MRALSLVGIQVELLLVGIKEGYPRDRIKQKIKSVTVDIEIQRTVLRVSNTRGSSSVQLILSLVMNSNI